MKNDQPAEHREPCVHSASAVEIMHAVASAPTVARTPAAISDPLLAKINAAIDSGAEPKALCEKARAEGKQCPYISHTPDFFVDLAAIPMGARINTTAVMNIMAKR